MAQAKARSFKVQRDRISRPKARALTRAGLPPTFCRRPFGKMCETARLDIRTGREIGRVVAACGNLATAGVEIPRDHIEPSTISIFGGYKRIVPVFEDGSQ